MENKRARFSFAWTFLLPEIQYMCREVMTPVTRAMLALTSQSELAEGHARDTIYAYLYTLVVDAEPGIEAIMFHQFWASHIWLLSEVRYRHFASLVSNIKTEDERHRALNRLKSIDYWQRKTLERARNNLLSLLDMVVPLPH